LTLHRDDAKLTSVLLHFLLLFALLSPPSPSSHWSDHFHAKCPDAIGNYWSRRHKWWRKSWSAVFRWQSPIWIILYNYLIISLIL
jgi:hypothetical protein